MWATEFRARLSCKSFITNTLKSGMGVRYTKSQDLEARHDRSAAFCDAGGYHNVCGGGGGGIELDAVARGVLDDAAGYGWAGGAEDGIGAGDGAVGAGVFGDAVSLAMVWALHWRRMNGPERKRLRPGGLSCRGFARPYAGGGGGGRHSATA
jgi:hypothetical protein